MHNAAEQQRYWELESQAFPQWNDQIWRAADLKPRPNQHQWPDGSPWKGNPWGPKGATDVSHARPKSYRPAGPLVKSELLEIICAVIDCALEDGLAPMSVLEARLTGNVHQAEGTAAQWLAAHPVIQSLFRSGGLIAVEVFAGLTPKEITAYDLYLTGHSWSEIGRAMAIPRGNAWNHVERAKSKLGRLNVYDAVDTVA